MSQHLVMFIVDDNDPDTTKEFLEKLYKHQVSAYWGIGHGNASTTTPVVVELSLPEYSGDEQDYIGDQIAEMQEEIASNKE